MINRPYYPRKKVAVVGGGSAGIGALWALNRSPHDVYIYDSGDRLGGHTNTVEFAKGKYKTLVDTGFIVMNEETYPNFMNFLKRIRVETVPTKMSFSVSRDQGLFEWASAGFNALFCQPGNLLSPKMWRMLLDILRFNQYAVDLLRTNKPTQETLGEYLDREGYSNVFRDDYLIPLTGAVWSASPDRGVLEFPAVTLIRFLWNHHLLSTFAKRPTWYTVATGSKTYIDTIMKGFPKNHVVLNTRVTAVTNENDGRVRIHTEGGQSEVFDHVILATHGDEAYSIIRNSATDLERMILENFQTTENDVVLHSDTSLMPESRKAWSAWNSLTKKSAVGSTGHVDQVSLTYNMNILQNIPRNVFGNVLVTLNPLHEPKPKTVQGRFKYRHAIYTGAAVLAQERLPEIQNKRGISYAGGWTKQGFHEDAFTSGLQAAVEHLGASIPFEIKDSTYSRGLNPELTFMDKCLRFWIFLIQVLFIGVFDRLAWSLTKTRRLASSRARALFSFPANDHFTTDTNNNETMNSIPRFGRQIAAEASNAWSCLSCRGGASTRFRHAQRRFLSESTPKRQQQQTQQQQQRTIPNGMNQMNEVYKRRNRSTAYYTISIILGTVAFSYGSVPMYKMICQTTGWGGQPVRAHGGTSVSSSDPEDLSQKLIPITDAKRIRVTFSASVSDVLPWKFIPQQREVRVLPGETALAFYTATNKSDKDIIGVATYSVTPAQVAPYFSKIQCFCFEEQRLQAGETVDMPVFFYLDPDLLKDLNMRGIETVTLNYTFFKARYDGNGKVKMPAGVPDIN
ncbi:amine oxidase [Podospora fimiseda]|uniref:Amine oxidase n=1 Tax=Podospora fimiseda TaxID=252190 RepID=A0AAN7H1X6_9PEZI|nr:amine oxidase [Podospora fimiseda]